ncbi:succinate dehydrogenase assembly factor 2 [Phyllobacterium sp. 0TCS1.6C]|uniref:succinate dehydrogenase assembly factor 2 n=1 Tax=unclassified Phyllobacterium TaxID=2638441 RepID=UPI002264902F|nr:MULTISPECIES: succinate dehydrogenase assembly factor 2 [unclassified Phyllobacterium]MCX8282230.1 succinate dehydrogenase assembly factor 2 [Phyllobacterium sp. 0TCS1.6C]MCX8294918.1 succinate dehydrogenase assembly factor 2 [Phyllobacterium sp. 0TCS1.6A]
MSGSSRTTADLSPRQRKILFRCWHRGMREVDLLLGQFANEHIDRLTDEELDQLETLMDELDRDLLKWFTGEAEVPTRLDTPIFRRIVTSRSQMKF